MSTVRADYANEAVQLVHTVDQEIFAIKSFASRLGVGKFFHAIPAM